jgi:hypothetical protein
MMFGFDVNAQNHVDTAKITELKDEIRCRLRAAAAQVGTPLNEAQARERIPQEIHKFAIKHAITEIAPLPLSGTPQQLLERLRAVQTHTEKNF